VRPAEPAAKIAAAHLHDLAAKDEALVRAQDIRGALERAQLETQQRSSLDISAPVGYVELALAGDTKRDRTVEHRLARTAAAERAPAIMHAGEEALLEDVAQVSAAGAAQSSAPRLIEQLERGLAVAILEVLPAQTTPVDGEQTPTRRCRYQRELLDEVLSGACSGVGCAGACFGVECAGAGTCLAVGCAGACLGVRYAGACLGVRYAGACLGVRHAGECLRVGWSRHVCMSHRAAHRPPQQLRR
jgi:hypothetical protein